MTIKETENQLELNLNVGFVLVVIVWLGCFGYISYQVWTLKNPRVLPPVSSSHIPSINQENLIILRSSVKSIPIGGLPTLRAEPFD